MRYPGKVLPVMGLVLAVLAFAIEAQETPDAATERAAGADAVTGSVQFIGNATVLIRFGPFTLLTDPNFIHKHEEVPLGYGLRATRLKDPALELEDLPPLDLVVLSHFHGDHFDRIAEERLERSVPIVTTPDAAEELASRGFTQVAALDTWQPREFHKNGTNLRITAMPGRHGPPLVHLVLPGVMGSMLEFEVPATGHSFRMYITGDTLAIDDLLDIPARYPDIDLALLHLGGTRVLGLLVTMDGEQGVRALRMVDPETAIPIHFDDYDRFKSPLSEFEQAVAAAGLTDKVHYLNRGESFQFVARPGAQGQR